MSRKKKFDPNEIKLVFLRCVGGTPAGASALAPKVGPLGLSAKKLADDIAKHTLAFKGLKVTVKLIVKNRQATIEVVPSAATLIIKALNEPERDPKDTDAKKVQHDGNVTLEQVYEIARVMRKSSMAKVFAGTVKEILGTCYSVGCTVEGVNPRALQKKIKSGDLVVPPEKAIVLSVVEKASDADTGTKKNQ